MRLCQVIILPIVITIHGTFCVLFVIKIDATLLQNENKKKFVFLKLNSKGKTIKVSFQSAFFIE